MFENDELNDAGGRLLTDASRVESLRPGAYIKTKSLILEKSMFRGMCERMDYGLVSIYGYHNKILKIGPYLTACS